MNEFLSDMYNTRETIGAAAPAQQEDYEKLAEAQLLDQALQAEGIDVEQLPPETILKVAYELFGENSALVKAAQAEGEGGPPPPAEKKCETCGKSPCECPAAEEKEAMARAFLAKQAAAQAGGGEEDFNEKIAQADFLGRVMAHSFVQEQDSIAKEALSKAEIAAKASELGGAALSKLRGAGEAVSGAARSAASAAKSKATEGVEAAGAHLGRHKGKYIAGGGGTVGGFTLGRLSKSDKGKEKNNSALDVLAEQRALEMLKEAGIDPTTGQRAPSDEEKLAAAVEQRALEMLAENGFLGE